MHSGGDWKAGAGALFATLLMTLLMGCTGISPERLAGMATVEVADGHSMHSVDSEMKLFTDSVNVKAGQRYVLLPPGVLVSDRSIPRMAAKEVRY